MNTNRIASIDIDKDDNDITYNDMNNDINNYNNNNNNTKTIVDNIDINDDDNDIVEEAPKTTQSTNSPIIYLEPNDIDKSNPKDFYMNKLCRPINALITDRYLYSYYYYIIMYICILFHFILLYIYDYIL